MAPIEPDTFNSNTIPLVYLGAYLTSIATLTALIVRSLFVASASLPPSQSVRTRQRLRLRHVQAYIGLSSLALLVALALQLQSVAVSYGTWADERGLSYPTALYGSPNGVFGRGQDKLFLDLQLGRWIRDTHFRHDVAEVAVERSRRFWWTQQAYLGSAAWSSFLGIEGLRRNVPHLWAFVALSQLVSLSYAQSLFCLAILLAPVTLKADGSHHIFASSVSTASSPKNVHFSPDSRGGQSLFERIQANFTHRFGSKPPSWAPYPGIHLLPLAITVSAIFLLPFAAGTPSFALVRFFPAAHMYVHTLLPFIVPASWGSSKIASSRKSYHYTRIYTFIALASIGLHVKATAVALIDNTPNSHRHRHSFPFFQTTDDDLSKMERSRTALANLIGAITDHPAVTAAGADVLLSGLQLIVWAAVRGLDISAMLKVCFGLIYAPSVDTIKSKADALVNGTKKPRRKLKNSEADSTSATSSPAAKKTPRRKKASAVNEGDEAFSPNDRNLAESGADEGDELVLADPESGALAWGLIVFGGLGFGAAGTWGADVLQYV